MVKLLTIRCEIAILVFIIENSLKAKVFKFETILNLPA